MKFRLFSILFLLITSAFSQNDYPTNYFENPVEIPIFLSGTFGELRTNHFHSGLDIKTQQKEGFNVLASAEGYVSRIRVSHWGYGKVVYITHPNGFTTVYAHLKKFSPKIEAYLKEKQYEQKTFEIQLFPNKDELLLEKGEVIAYSGSTGGFVGPHLHFEIRDSNAKPINPMLFGIEVKDTRAPTINVLMAYPLNDSTQINQSNAPLQINFKQLSDGNLLAEQITASGEIGLGINTFDRLNGAMNKNGIYSMEMSVNGQKTYMHTVNTYSFAETKYLNLLIDYDRYADINQRIQRCFVVPSNPLSIYSDVVDNGYLTIEDGYRYNAEIIVKDFKGNHKKLIVPIQGKTDSIEVFKEDKVTPYPIKHKEFNKFTEGIVNIAFPKNTFYNDFYLDFEVKDSVAFIHTKKMLLSKNYTLTFDVSNYSEIEKQQLFIAGFNSRGNPSYKQTIKKDKTFYITTKDLGKFTLLSDTKKPTLKLSNFKNEQWMTHYKKLVLKVSDDLSGLKSYSGEIDGEWILLEYNPKYGTLTYDFSDKKFTTAKHQLKVIAIDNVGNANTIEATFYRKK